eukprot:TRINITY_DN12984_c0_g1_i1.p1 TRINITY_DN12984_c0_g1~~TRINITY_DN12984_c0_g1_i1.p1  ORF type:complete len:493 (+),score=101.75 TRINITY_DN12984_c0_g1_i1:43-1521(+)
MASSPTHYEVLGLTRAASQKDIRGAFKKQALRCHPDKNPGGEAQFKKVNRAYAVLSDEAAKRKYDNEQDGRRERKAATARTTTQTTTNGAFGKKYGHYDPAYDHTSTRNFINKIMEEDRKVEKHKMDQSFASWYKQKQTDWRQAEAAVQEAENRAHWNKMEEERQAALRSQRLRDIEDDLARNKEQEERQRAADEQTKRERARAFERKKAQALAEIEEEEKRYQTKFQQLSSKWACNNNVQLVRNHRENKERIEKERRGAAEHEKENAKNYQTTRQNRDCVPENPSCSPPTTTPADVTSPSGVHLEDEELDATLRAVRKQREELRQARTRMKAEEMEAWKSLADLKAGNFDFDELPSHRGPRLFDWEEPSPKAATKTTPAEELRAARLELEAMQEQTKKTQAHNHTQDKTVKSQSRSPTPPKTCNNVETTQPQISKKTHSPPTSDTTKEGAAPSETASQVPTPTISAATKGTLTEEPSLPTETSLNDAFLLD